MRTLWFLGLIVLLLAVTAVASPWIAIGLASLGLPFQFSRVYNRYSRCCWWWRSLPPGGASISATRRRSGCGGAAGRAISGGGLLVGSAGIMVGLFACWLGGAVAPRLRYDLAKTVGLGAAGLLGAVIVGVGEETLFRGVLLRRLSADTGRVSGVLLSTALYAVVHALRPGGARDAYAWAGVERTLALLAPLGNPGVLPSIVGLFGFGLLLVFARLRSGGLWLPIGIHAAWVAVFRVGRLVLDPSHAGLADRSRLAAAGGRGRRMDRPRRHARSARRRVARHPVTRPGDRCLRRATIRLATSRSGGR